MTRTILTKTTTLDTIRDYENDEADVLMTAADVASGNRFESDGTDLVVAHNTGASTRTITISSVADPYGRTKDIIYSLQAGEYASFGPFRGLGWKQTDGYLYLSADHADVKFGIVGVGKQMEGGGSEPTTSFNFRDLFQDAVGAGSVNGSAATPGPGNRTATDVESKTYIIDGEDRLTMDGQATASWGDQVVTWPAISRSTGRCLIGLLDIGDSANVVAFGLANGAITGDPANVGHGFIGDGLRVGFISDLASSDQYLEALRGLRPLPHLVVVAINDIGAVVLVSTIGDTTGFTEVESKVISKYPDARVLWVDYNDTTASLTPFLSSASASSATGVYLRDVRVVDVSSWASADFLAGFADRFTRDDSALDLGNSWTAHSGVWGIDTNQAYQVSGGGRTVASHATTLTGGDAIWHWRVKMPTGQVELAFRFKDASNYIKADLQNAAIYLRTMVAGAEGNIGSTAVTLTAGNTYDVTIISSGNKYRIFIDGADAFGSWQTDAGNNHLTETGIGIGTWSNPSGELFDNVACWPLETTLPALLQTGTVPLILTGDATLASDSFTDANGTALDAHSAEAGGAWTENAGVWTIQSNKAAFATGTVSYATQDLSVTDVECQVVITTPGVGTTFQAGIILRYEDDSNYFYARIFMDPSQPASDEIEFTKVVSGTAFNAIRKLNLADYYANSTNYTLKVQCQGDFIFTWLDGQPITSYQMQSGDPNGTRFGIYASRDDAGCVFNDWIVKTL